MMDMTELHRLVLDDGLAVDRDGRQVRYRVVRLRETTVADEMAATRAAERVVTVDGQPRLMVSEAMFRYALTAQHVVAFEGEGQHNIGAGIVDLELLGKLSSHDLALLERRVYLINLAAEVRYGNLTEADFTRIASGTDGSKDTASPQPQGQAGDVAPAGAAAEPGPEMLADYAGSAAGGAAARPGR